MPVFVLKNAYILVNAVDLSDFVRSVTLAYSAEPLDNTGMSNDTRTRIGGLKDWTIDLEMFQDYGSGNVDATLFPLVGSSTFTVVVQPTTAIAASTNPQFTGTGFLATYNPFQGTVGEISMTPTRIEAAGDLSRVTST